MVFQCQLFSSYCLLERVNHRLLWDELSWYIVGRLVHLVHLGRLLLLKFEQCYIIATLPCSFDCSGDCFAPVL